MDLKESARQWVLQELPYEKTDAVLVAHLNGLDVHGLLVVYHNWASRLIAPRRREIHVSASLREKLATSVHKAVFDQIIEDIKAGRHLKCYLTRCVIIAAQIPRNDVKFNRRRDLDLLLTEWKLHHLHLSTNVEPDGFVTRTDDLLFGVFRPDEAYLVDIMPHGSWTKDHLLRVLRDEPPNAKGAHVIRGIISLARNYSDEEHQRRRAAGINTPRMVGGQATMNFGLISAAGTSYKASRNADYIISYLDGFEETWVTDPGRLRAACKAKGVELPPSPEFEF